MNQLDALYDRIKNLNGKRNFVEWSPELKDAIINDFTFFSNKIEGNALSYGQTINVLKGTMAPGDESKNIQDVFSMKSHKEFFNELLKSYKEEFSTEYIKELHRKYMDNILQWGKGTGENYSPGVLKWAQNYTMLWDGKMHYYMPPKEVPEALNHLCEQVNTGLKEGQNPIELASYFHQKFLNEIHPFVDGNGRVGRMLTNQILVKGGLSPVTFFHKESKMEYYKLLNGIDSSKPEDMERSHKYFAEMQIKSLEARREFLLKFKSISLGKDRGIGS